MTSCRPSHARFVSFASWLPRCARAFRSRAGRVRLTRAWSWSPGTSRRDIPVETTGSPTFLGSPNVPLPCSPTPAGPTASGHCDAVVLSSREPKRRPQRLELSRLDHTASALAVYASQRRLPGRHARLASAAGQALPEGLNTLWAPLKGFRVLNPLVHVLLSQVSWRKVPLPCPCYARLPRRLRVRLSRRNSVFQGCSIARRTRPEKRNPLPPLRGCLHARVRRRFHQPRAQYPAISGRTKNDLPVDCEFCFKPRMEHGTNTEGMKSAMHAFGVRDLRSKRQIRPVFFPLQPDFSVEIEGACVCSRVAATCE